MDLTNKPDIKKKREAAVRIKLLTAITSAILFLATGSVPAYSQSVSISARFDTTTIWIGEQTGFTVTIEQPPGMYVSFLDPAANLSDKIEILSAMRSDTLITDGNSLRIINSWTVTSFDRGEHYAEAIPFVFLDEGNERTLHTRRTGLEVLAPEIDEEAGIYDIKDPLGISWSIVELWPWILLLTVLAVLSWYLMRYLKMRKTGQPVFAARTPPEPAHLIAMRELRNLKSESLWEKGMIKEYYTKLTEIVRRYIERRFGVTAMERTSREIIEELQSNDGLAKDVIGLLDQCFSIADLVKFAKARPGDENNEKCLNTAFHFVKATFEPAFPDAGSREREYAGAETKGSKAANPGDGGLHQK